MLKLLERIVWFPEGTDATFNVKENLKSVINATARPIIISDCCGIAVGLFYCNDQGFGYWCSTNTCNTITAWRIAQILPRIKTVRISLNGYNKTLCGLVNVFYGDYHDSRVQECANDFGMTIEEFEADLKKLKKLWPSAVVLHSMWQRLSESEQNQMAKSVRQAITEGLIDHNNDLEDCVEQAEIRLQIAARKQREDYLIARGLDDRPWDSLQIFMSDIGVDNLLKTVAARDAGEPKYYKWPYLDREIMKDLIGDQSTINKIPLRTKAKISNDKSAYWSQIGSETIAFTDADFDDAIHPKVIIQHKAFSLACVSFDRNNECFQVSLWPVGSVSDGDKLMSIRHLREELQLEPGTKAPWLNIATPSAGDRFKRLLHIS